MCKKDEISIAAVKDEEQYDAAIKALFMRPRILAPVIQMAIPEYADVDVEDIMACISGISDKEAVDDVSAKAMQNASDGVMQLNTEQVSVSDKLIVFDVHFKIPNPKDQRDTLTRFRMTKEDVVGHAGDKEENYDLMEVVMIRRGKESNTEGIFDYLNGLFTSDINRMDRYSHIKDDADEAKEVQNMEGFGATLARKNMEEGRKEGMIETLSSLVKDGLLSLHEAAKRAGMSESAFTASMEKLYNN